MRLTIILLFVLSFQLIAENVNGQDAIVKLKTNKVSVRQLISEIEKQNDYLLAYSNREVNTSREVNLKNKADKVSEYLNQTFDGTDIDYDFENNYYIILAKKDSENITLEILSTKAKQQSGKIITGRINDSSGQPLSGVTVVIKGTNYGTTTNENGVYSINNIFPNSTLVISFVGMKTQEIVVGNQTSINITMEDESIGLEEVIAIGYGTMRKSDITGSVVRADLSKLLESPNISIGQSLQGTIPGLNVGAVNTAGSDPSITIRGRNSISGGTSPLIVLDGIIYRGSLVDINPNDIESIDVLKTPAQRYLWFTSK